MKWSARNVLPSTAGTCLIIEAGFSVGLFKGLSLTGKSGREMDPDGTNSAKSGGWSFPTGGLAYKAHRHCNHLERHFISSKIKPDKINKLPLGLQKRVPFQLKQETSQGHKHEELAHITSSCQGPE